MSGTIILVRHAHALHNVNNDTSIRDPRLTQLGEKQSVRLIENNPGSDFHEVGCIYTSPLKRAIHSTLLAFIDVADDSFYFESKALNHDGSEVILEPLLQEMDDTNALPCNTGSDVSMLKQQWPKLDFKPLQNVSWPKKEGLFSPNLSSTKDRAAAFLKVLETKSKQLSQNGGNKDIVVVTHGGFIQVLTDSTVDFGLAKAKNFEIVREGEVLKLIPA